MLQFYVAIVVVVVVVPCCLLVGVRSTLFCYGCWCRHACLGSYSMIVALLVFAAGTFVIVGIVFASCVICFDGVVAFTRLGLNFSCLATRGWVNKIP